MDKKQVNYEERFFQWYNDKNTPSDDLALYNRVCGFGNLFEDMLFKDGTTSYELAKQQIENKDGTIFESGSYVPEEIDCFDYSMFIYKAEEPNDCDGFFDSKERILCVPSDAEDLTVLHEMTHLHEFVINELPLYWHDMLYWALYTGLKKKIRKLDKAITKHANVLNGSKLYKQGGLHDILFLLKSFDLDIRMGYSLGTVFGYGRIEIFKEFDYIKENKRKI